TELSVQGEFAKIQGDEVVLRQVFGNLVRNAAEACDTVGVTPAIVVIGRVERDQSVCRVTVDDNGPGIPEAERERVFRPFVTTRSRGTGLGLAIAQKIVLTHNGRVSIGGSSSGGASIRVVLPLA
ncbi:MAG: ATP-binding protein, partial [Vicinamibacterales bacterium]